MNQKSYEFYQSLLDFHLGQTVSILAQAEQAVSNGYLAVERLRAFRQMIEEPEDEVEAHLQARIDSLRKRIEELEKALEERGMS